MEASHAHEWTPTPPADPDAVRIVLISECAAPDPHDNYGASPDSLFDRTTLAAFATAGLHAYSMEELTARGIYATVAVREPKSAPMIPSTRIKSSAAQLATELAAFRQARAYLLMGDVAIAAINHLARTRTGARAIPAGATYRIRGGDYSLEGIRLFPSYLQAGPAWFIEASKRAMIAEDIRDALALADISD